jgi:hypothetical protein
MNNNKITYNKWRLGVVKWWKSLNMTNLLFHNPWRFTFLLVSSRGDIAIISLMLVILAIYLSYKYGKKYKWLFIIAILLFIGPNTIIALPFVSLFFYESARYQVPIGCDRNGMCL